MLRIRNLLASLFLILVGISVTQIRAEDRLSITEAEQALRKATDFFRNKVSAGGGYLWLYSEDLTLREGEGTASVFTVWVQPPGTPTVGAAYLEVFKLTGDEYFLEAAKETATALVNGQLESGGWDYRIEFAPKNRTRYRYRIDVDRPQARNTTTLDDNTTQAALSFLMQVDQALNFQDDKIHNAVEYALKKLLEVQYPNGAWPQRFNSPPDAGRFPVLKASYNDDWSREYVKKDYRSYYTFNDNTIADMIQTMFAAERIYGERRFREAAIKAGEFILLAQLPEPQPVWAQQYNAEMKPAWARRFEPPSVTGGESQGVLRTLMYLYQQTGEKKFLEPIPRAVKYLQRSQLADGRLARFYEQRTNKPLYFTKQYELTYSDADMPTHYGFQVGSSLAAIEKEFQRLTETEYTPPKKQKKDRPRMSRTLAVQARKLVDQLDRRGAWAEQGSLKKAGQSSTGKIIDCRTFARNIQTLGQFIAAGK